MDLGCKKRIVSNSLVDDCQFQIIFMELGHFDPELIMLQRLGLNWIWSIG